MKKLILLLLILCNINITAQSLNDLYFGSADNLDVITWNLEWFPKNGQATLDSLTTAITALDADIIAVQEINNTTEFNNLISQLSGYSGYYGGSNLRLGFIYKTSLLIDSITTIFSNNSYNFAGRPPLVLHLSFNNHNFTVINVHFKCCGDGILDLSNSSDEETRRYYAMNMIQQYIDQNHSNDNVIVLGDFNDLLTDISINNVFQQVINDSTNYTFADMAIANGSSANWSYPTWPSHLDHILITNELTDELNNGTIETILIDNYFSGGFAQYDATISDHRPVGISLGFPIYGCTDSLALNFDPLATVDDSTCIYQMTYVPDDNFEQALINIGYDNVLDDYVLTSNINTVTSLYVGYNNISDLTGIEDFTSLTGIDCSGNQLTSLDVSQNTALTSLDVDGNQLTSLDVSQNTALTSLACNENQLTSLDLSNNTVLYGLYCWNNQLTTLDVSNNITLSWLFCNNNQLTGLDLSNNTALTNLQCENNQLTSLDLSNNTALAVLRCRNNQLTSLDLRNLPLIPHGPNHTFTSNYNLYCIDVDSAAYSTANWSNCKDPWAIFSNNCQLGVPGCTDSTNINYNPSATVNDGSCIYAKTNVPDNNFESYLEANGMGDGIVNNDSVYTYLIANQTSLDISINPWNPLPFNPDSIADLTGIEDFDSLQILECAYNLLTSLDVSNNTALTVLYCGQNNLTSLDVSGATALIVLNCDNNQLTSLDVSQNTALIFLIFENNQLTSLDLSNNTALANWFGNNNQLTTVDLRNGNNTNMGHFWSGNNPNLYCIDVDDPAYSTANWGGYVDSWTSFSNNCQNEIFGCTDSLSCNYDSTATIDDGSCLTAYGCMDPTAFNYDSTATCDDSSCLYCDLTNSFIVIQNTLNNCDGLIIANASSSNGPITYLWSNGSTLNNISSLCYGMYTVTITDVLGCVIQDTILIGVTYGCTDSTATNYNPLATVDDGSCMYSCGPITGVYMSDVIHDRATFNFDNMNTANCIVDQLRIKYSGDGGVTWSQKNMGSPTGYNNGVCNSTQRTDKIATGLNSSTTYQWQMKVWYCLTGATAWVNGPNFITEDLCPNVINFTATPVNTVKVNFTWDTTTAYSFVRIKLRVDTTNASWLSAGGFGVNYPILSKQKSGLSPGATYRGQARTWCSPTGGAYRSTTWTSLVFWTQPTSARLEGENTAITNLEVYPNPSRDIFNITFTSNEKQDLEIRIINVIGERVFVESKQQFVGQYTKQINLGEYPKAIYFLEIETDDGIINKKLILQ